MASPPSRTFEPGLEAVHKHFEESSGLEADSRGLELATPVPPAPHERISFWKRYRAWILGLVVICLVAGIIGGAVGGTKGKHNETPNPSSTSPVNSSPSSGTMSGTASPQTGYYAYPTPISSLGQETIDLYMLGFDQALYYKQYANSTWQPSSSTFSDLHGSISANVAAVSRSLGNTDLFARADDNSILRKWRSYNQTTWSPSLQSWQSMGFWSGSSPELVSWSSDRVDAFIVGGDSLMYTMTWQESTGDWSSWSWLGANEKPHTWLNYTPTVVSWASGRYDLFGVSSANNALYHRFLVTDNSWQPQTSYEALGGYCTSRPIAVSPVTGRLDVFVRGGDAGLWHIAYYSDNANTATWSNFSSLGNLSIAGEPHAVSWSADRIDVFAWGAQDHAVWHTSSPGLHTTWSPWESLGGDSSGPPKAVSKAPGQLDVFAVGRNGNLMRRDWDERRGTWNPGEGWEDLGSP